MGNLFIHFSTQQHITVSQYVIVIFIGHFIWVLDKYINVIHCHLIYDIPLPGCEIISTRYCPCGGHPTPGITARTFNTSHPLPHYLNVYHLKSHQSPLMSADREVLVDFRPDIEAPSVVDLWYLHSICIILVNISIELVLCTFNSERMD